MSGQLPKGKVKPMGLDALECMSRESFRSKNCDEFATADASVMNFVSSSKTTQQAKFVRCG